jgi:hypothetical protein
MTERIYPALMPASARRGGGLAAGGEALESIDVTARRAFRQYAKDLKDGKSEIEAVARAVEDIERLFDASTKAALKSCPGPPFGVRGALCARRPDCPAHAGRPRPPGRRHAAQSSPARGIGTSGRTLTGTVGHSFENLSDTPRGATLHGISGTGGGSRTRTGLPPTDFEHIQEEGPSDTTVTDIQDGAQIGPIQLLLDPHWSLSSPDRSSTELTQPKPSPRAGSDSDAQDSQSGD